ncbi:MAG: c-type cytochrome [Verrucomicrobiota bacterium]
MIRLGILFLMGTFSANTEPAMGEENPDRQDAPAGASHFQKVCANCHGGKGEGKKELMAPSIAAMPDWYIEAQIAKFKRDQRGTEPADAAGLTMHAIASTLDAEAVQQLAAYIDQLPIIPTKNTRGGDPKLGEEVYADICMECHRFNGRGEPYFRSAQLIGLPDWYIVRQLKNFRDGVRGSDVEDEEGQKMHRVTMRMDDKTIDSLAAHIAVLADEYSKEESRARLRRE